MMSDRVVLEKKGVMYRLVFIKSKMSKMSTKRQQMCNYQVDPSLCFKRILEDVFKMIEFVDQTKLLMSKFDESTC